MAVVSAIVGKVARVLLDPRAEGPRIGSSESLCYQGVFYLLALSLVGVQYDVTISAVKVTILVLRPVLDLELKKIE